MKKIYNIFGLALLILLAACDYNGSNFPGYDDARHPVVVSSYTYTLSSSDYNNIAATVTKVYTDSVTALKNQLKLATNAADSATIKANIDRINLKLSTDSTLVAGAAIGVNKLFISAPQASKYIASFLSSKYPYVDAGSSAAVSYNQSYDTTKISAGNKYTLVYPTDYSAMGTAVGTPGRGNFFSATVDANYFLPIYLKKTYPFAIKGDIKMIRYNYGNVTTQIASVYIFDGANWVNYNSSAQAVKTFVYKSGKWLDLLVFKESFTKDFGAFTPIIVTGTYNWTWGSFNGGCAVANAYQKGPTEIWLVSKPIDLKDRSNPTLTFDNAINYGSGLVIPDLAGVYVSADYTNDVAKATWEKLNMVYPTTFSWTFFNSGKMSLKSYADKKVVIAFKYVSAGTAIGWEISNVNILDE